MKASERFVREVLAIGAIELVPEGRELKSRRLSPYFFNAGLFNTGAHTYMLAKAYADAIFRMRVDVDVIFGPAYKGIPLAVAITMLLWEKNNLNVGWAFNRKEEKNHGEGGTLVGASVKEKKVLIVDDVMTTGFSSGESVDIVRLYEGLPVGCVIAFDRQEKGLANDLSAVQEFEKTYEIPVRAAATLEDLINVLYEKDFLLKKGGADIVEKIFAYQQQYGANYG